MTAPLIERAGACQEGPPIKLMTPAMPPIARRSVSASLY